MHWKKKMVDIVWLRRFDWHCCSKCGMHSEWHVFKWVRKRTNERAKGSENENDRIYICMRIFPNDEIPQNKYQTGWENCWNVILLYDRCGIIRKCLIFVVGRWVTLYLLSCIAPNVLFCYCADKKIYDNNWWWCLESHNKIVSRIERLIELLVLDFFAVRIYIHGLCLACIYPNVSHRNSGL